MRQVAIFLFFLVCLTAALRLGDLIAIALLSVTFLIFHSWAEELDTE
jgi:hypothetical protein